jgi:hypothetical protein
MPPGTRLERQPSRPPLTSRIRASFEGKRKNSSDGVTSPTYTNGFITQDPDALRDAVDKAINGEAFQNAIAANLAKLIKPSIKDALDTLQPVVEAVYAHEMLLRRTSRSVENILEKMDSTVDADRSGFRNEKDEWKTSAPHLPLPPREAPSEAPAKEPVAEPALTAVDEQTKQELRGDNSQIETKLSELSSAIMVHNDKIAELVESIAGIHNAWAPTKESVDSLKVSSELSNTTMSVVQAQLDQLQADIGNITDAVGSDLGANVKSMHKQVAAQDTSLLSSHTTKLDAITTDLAALKGHSDSMEKLDAISANLEALKNNVQAGITSSGDSFAVITPQIASIVSSVAGHASSLADLKAGDSNPDILAAVQKSNESHEATHAAALNAFKERSLLPGSESVPGAGSDSKLALEALAADLTILIENTKTGLASNNENLAGLGTKVDEVLTTLEGHRASNQSPEILAAVQKSNESHAAHADALENIKSREVVAAPAESQPNLDPKMENIISTLSLHTDSHASHTAALEGVKALDSSTASGEGRTTLEPQIATIISTLEQHTTALKDLRFNAASRSEVATDMPFGEQMSSIVGILGSHTTLLNEIKDDISAEILTTLHDIKDSNLTHHNILNEVREADVSDEVLTALHSLNDSHTNHAAVLADIQAAVHASNDFHAAHTTALDEIKSTRSSEPIAVAEASGAGVVDFGPVLATLEQQNSTLAAIKEATNASNESHTAHRAALDEIKEATSASQDFHTFHEGSLNEIKGTVNTLKNYQASHTSSLDGLREEMSASRDFHTSHAAGLAELRSIQPVESSSGGEAHTVDLAGLETHLNTISTTLETQHITLSGIQEVVANPEILKAIKASHEVLTSNHSLLMSHASLLDTIKESSSHDDILTNISSLKAIIEDSKAGVDAHGAAVQDLYESTKSSHSEITSAIADLALGGTAGAGVGMLAGDSESDFSKEVLEEVRAVRDIVEKSSSKADGVHDIVTKMEAQIDINHTTIITSITTLSDEIKAEIDASGTEITSSIGALSAEVREIDSKGLSTAIERHGNQVKELSGKVDEIGGHVQGTGSQIEELKHGVHFNERGVRQLKEHIVATGLPADSLARGVDKREVDDINETAQSQPILEKAPFSDTEATKEFEPIAEEGPVVEPESSIPSEPLLKREPTIAPVGEHAAESGFEESYEPQLEESKEVSSDPAEKDNEAPIPEDSQEPQIEDPHDATSFPVEEFAEERALYESHGSQMEVHGESTRGETSAIDRQSTPIHEDISPVEEYPLFDGDPILSEPGPSHEGASSPVSSPFLERSPPLREQETYYARSIPTELPSSPVEPSTPTQEIEPPLASPMSPTAEYEEGGSASTSAIASPLSSSCGESASGKKGKKGKKPKKGKKTPFVFDPDDEDEGSKE